MANLSKLQEQIEKQKMKLETEKAKMNKLESKLKAEQLKQTTAIMEEFECHTAEELKEALLEWHEKKKAEKKESETDED
ncbi:MAG: hypothetical protein NC489_27750 [Ruminococcus flavefaciens]|nr:hypothetical protein [Ruminococcus flavefaciens]